MRILLQLKSGYQMPALGFGTWKLSGPNAKEVVKHALAVGYRHIDTADHYGNHREIGEAIHESGIPRQEIFLTSKVWRDSLHAQAVQSVIGRFLQELNTDYLDLLLVHWPNRDVPIAETLGAFAVAVRRGNVRSLGVSNFTIDHLREALTTGVPVSVNQVEFHPSFNQRALKDFCDEQGIVVTAYSPIGRGADLQLPVIKSLAQKYRRRESQIILNWLLSHNIAAIPKAADAAHIEDNFQTLAF